VIYAKIHGHRTVEIKSYANITSARVEHSVVSSIKRVVKPIFFLDRLSRQRKHERISIKAIILHYAIVRLELVLYDAVNGNKVSIR
jgi:hypothetical protein